MFSIVDPENINLNLKHCKEDNMKRLAIDFTRAATLASAVALLPVSAWAVPVPFTVGGNNTTASIQTTVDNFRTAAGNPNNGNAAGPLAGGRREINWDGGGAVSTPAPGGTPFDVFLNIRGGRFTTPGTGFNQATPQNLADQFTQPSYTTAFGVFSPQRLFVPIGSNITDAFFFIPGTNGATAATVSAFGVIFTDVDLANTTKLDYFDQNGNLLTSVFVPVGTTPNGSFSFAGVSFNAGEQIARVRITTGNSALGPTDSPADFRDIVAMDDFIYSEPIARVQGVPEPATFGLMMVGLVALAGRLLRQRQQA